MSFVVEELGSSSSSNNSRYVVTARFRIHTGVYFFVVVGSSSSVSLRRDFRMFNLKSSFGGLRVSTSSTSMSLGYFNCNESAGLAGGLGETLGVGLGLGETLGVEELTSRTSSFDTWRSHTVGVDPTVPWVGAALQLYFRHLR